MSTWVIFIAVLSAVVYLLLRPDIPITGKLVKLGEDKYDIVALDAPAASGLKLKILTYLMTKSRVGPAIRRYLLDNNRYHLLRDLASQIHLSPMYYPMKRLDREQHAAASSPTSEEDLRRVLQTGFETPDTHTYGINSQGGAADATAADSGAYLPTVTDYAARYRSGSVLPSVVVAESLRTARAWEQQGLRIFASLHDEDIMAQARASDQRHRAGAPLSIFDGVPVAYKDMLDVKGYTIYDGRDPRRADTGIVSIHDDLVVSRMRELGAIIFGTTVMVENGVSPLGWNAHFQGPYNPHSPNRYSGGSSSGSAVAVATGLVPVALGYDGGGSIRVPATMSGVHGHATTFGRIPMTNRTSSTMIKAGPISATAEDAALLYAALTPDEPHSFYGRLYDGGFTGPPNPHLQGFADPGWDDLSGVRMGVYSEWFDDSDPHVRARCRQAVEFLQSRGVEVVEVHVPHLQLMSMAHSIKIASEFAAGADLHYFDDSMEAMSRIVVGIGSSVSALEVAAAEKLRAWGFDFMARLFAEQRLDAIVNPTIGVEVPFLSEEAKAVGESDTALSVQVMKYVQIANFLGLPGYSVPLGCVRARRGGEAGKGPRDLAGAPMVPVGLHLLGNHWEDHKLMRLARVIEHGFTNRLSRVDNPRPLFFHDPLRAAH